MKELKILSTIAAFFMLAAFVNIEDNNSSLLANSLSETVEESIIIIEMGSGTARVGFDNQDTPIEFPFVWNERGPSPEPFKTDFANLMQETYSKLNVSNPADHPVIIVESEHMNEWRRVDMAELLMGHYQIPWFYPVPPSFASVFKYGDIDTGTSFLIYSEQDLTTFQVVSYGDRTMEAVKGFPNTSWINDFNDTDTYDVTTARGLGFAATTYLKDSHLRSVDEMYDAVNNIVLAGSNFQDLTTEDVDSIRHIIDMNISGYGHRPIRIVDEPNRHLYVWLSGKSVAEFGIEEWSFTQELYQEKGAEEIRRAIYN